LEEKIGPLLSHVGFVVLDISKEIKKWRISGYRLQKEVYDHEQNIFCCLLRHPYELPIELVSPGLTGSHPLTSRIKQGGGLDHICYRVGDLDEIKNKELEVGSLLILDKTYSTLFESQIVFFYRQSGLMVEYLLDSSDKD
jgi:methylmalonyl-CoA/ethylmalonyl-CoA epimerase